MPLPRSSDMLPTNETGVWTREWPSGGRVGNFQGGVEGRGMEGERGRDAGLTGGVEADAYIKGDVVRSGEEESCQHLWFLS